mgnify:CR=1 FL=1
MLNSAHGKKIKKLNQLSLFPKKEIKISKRKVNADLSEVQISDEALKNLLPKLQLVSSKQLSKILTKKNDDALRVARSENRGFNWYKDKFGNVYYNLPEVMKDIGVGIVE